MRLGGGLTAGVGHGADASVIGCIGHVVGARSDRPVIGHRLGHRLPELSQHRLQECLGERTAGRRIGHPVLGKEGSALADIGEGAVLQVLAGEAVEAVRVVSRKVRR